MKVETKTFLGLKFSVFRLTDLMERVKTVIEQKKQLIIFGYSLTVLPKFRYFPEFFIYSNTFDIFLADGRGIYLLFKLLGFPLKSDISIPRFAEKLMEFANENAYKVLLFGAKEETNRKATGKSRIKYPNAVICNGINGYFKKEDEADIVNKINKENPDILLVGISSPIKERFVAEWKSKLNAKIILPCGGVIDAFAEETAITPPLIKKMGMAWLYRFMQEPVRLFKPIFLNGLSIIFILLPVLFFNVIILRNKEFSIPQFYGINTDTKKIQK